MNLDSSLPAVAPPPLAIIKTPVAISSDSLAEWVAGLRSAGVRRAAPALILTLENLRRSDLPPSRLISALKLLKAPVLKTCAALPKPWETAIKGHKTSSLTLEQRLYLLMFQNLHQALQQLDRCHLILDASQTRKRNWVVRNLFRFLERHLKFAALWRAVLPSNTWRGLHDLYVYLMVRRVQPVLATGVTDISCRGVDPEVEYKQLLLFGIITELTQTGARNGALMDGLGLWARQSVLEDPERLDGARGLFLVELSEDSPPRRYPGIMESGFRGWVLVPPAEFLEQLELAIKGKDGQMSGEWDLGPSRVSAMH